jgi:lipid-A-disaccharide synthase
MRYYIISGEASGDLHGSNLVKQIRSADTKAEIRGFGGDLMEKAGTVLARHYKQMSFMGFIEVFFNLRKIFNNLNYCKQDISAFKPDALIFIDFSGFNLRVAQWAKTQGFRTHYYITPQIWASRENRIAKIKSSIDHLYVILPFEPDFYAKHQVKVNFVGHPLIDAIQQYKNTAEVKETPKKPLIVLLPGSRKQEIKKMLPIMSSVCNAPNEYQYIVAGASHIEKAFYESHLKKSIEVRFNQTYDLLERAHAALVTSGTATLETALFKVPQVVCYKANALTYFIAKQIIDLKYISLVNIILDREAVTELIQNELTTRNLSRALEAVLDSTKRAQLNKDYAELEKSLGQEGASERAAKLIIEKTKQQLNSSTTLSD